MKAETKRDWQAAFVAIVLMAGTHTIYGFADWAEVFIGALVCLIVGGILVLIWEKIGILKKTPKTSGDAMRADASAMSPLIRRATAVKGKPLTREEREKLECLDEEIIRLEQKVEALSAQHDKEVTDSLREEAERVFALEVERARRKPLTSKQREELVEERERLKRRMRELGYKVNETEGPNEEGR